MKKLEKYKKSANDETSAVGRFAAYTVAARMEGKLLWRRVWMLTGYAVVDVAYLILFLAVVQIPQ